MSFAEVAAMAGSTGGPIAGHSEINAEGAGASFGVHVADVESIPRPAVPRSCVTGRDRTPARRSIPIMSRASIQGGAAQGIGWALNEEYIYGEDGQSAERRLP